VLDLPPSANWQTVVLALSAERTRYAATADARQREAFRRGRALGRREGWELCTRRRNAEFRAWVADCHILDGTPWHAELERRRWGPDGRARFADPRPGDFPGREPRR
jgi:hypothetical protein